MRLRAILFAVVVLAGAGAGGLQARPRRPPPGSRRATADAARTTALDAAGQDWASVAVDGLKVTLAGAAPDETSRFRALEIARQIVDAAAHRRRDHARAPPRRCRRRPSRSSSCATRRRSR